MSIERPQPYIGLSGVTNDYQQYWLMDQFVWQGLDSSYVPQPRQIALGVKAVHKTQYLDIENKYGRDWYPVGEKDFAEAMDWGGIQSLKVAQTYFDTDHVHDPEYRQAFTERLCERGKAWLNAIQFDMLPWHEDDQVLSFLENVKESTGHAVLLQAHGEAMNQLGPEGVAQRLGHIAGALDYVLFDASHGKGVRMNPEALKPFLYETYNSEKLAGVGVSVAGGLSADVVRQDLPSLLRDYPDLSWDAEGQLHPMGVDGTRPLDPELARAYLEASAEVLRQV